MTLDDSDNMTGVASLTIDSAGILQAGSTPAGTSPLEYNGYLYATKLFNNTWNDIADFQDISDKLEYGKCYYDTFDGAKICNVRCQKSVIGIASDTFGYALGVDSSKLKAPIAVSGWVLANVDKIYESGDVLTNDENGNLTKMTNDEKLKYPERIVAIYKKPEYKEYFGIGKNKIPVNDRHWVKVK